MGSEQESLEVLDEYYIEWNRGDIAALSKKYTHDLRVHIGRETVGATELLAYRRQMAVDYDEFHATTEDVVCQENKVAARWTTRQRNRKSGLTSEVLDVTIYRMECNEIAEIWDIRSEPSEV